MINGGVGGGGFCVSVSSNSALASFCRALSAHNNARLKRHRKAHRQLVGLHACWVVLHDLYDFPGLVFSSGSRDRI